MGEMPWFVAARFGGALKPGNRLIVALLLDQVGANVVVGIAKVGVDLNGALALGNGLVNAALKMVSPAEKGVSFGGGMHFE